MAGHDPHTDGASVPIQAKKGGSFAAALSASCPRCNAGSLFAGGGLKGFVKFVDRCNNCGLDMTRFNVGDGPAAFLTLVVGTFVVILAVWLQLAVTPPWWVHVLLWVPLTIGGTMGGLRIAKAALLQAEFNRRASEAGRSE